MKRALVLEGGGAKGSYQIGAYKALRELNIDFDYVVGTSIGAINAAMICQGDWNLAEKIWKDIKYSDILDCDDDKISSFLNDKISVENAREKIEFLKKVIENKGIEVKPLKRLLDDYIDEDRIRNSKVRFGLNTVDVKNRRMLNLFIEDIPKGKLKDYIRASSNLFLFKQDIMEGENLIDGGYIENNPYKMVDELSDEIVIVSLKPWNLEDDLIYGDKYTIIKSDDENFPRSLEFEKDKMRYAINLGYYDTMRVYCDLFGCDYYFRRISKKDSLNVILSAFYDGGNLNNFIAKKLPIVFDDMDISPSMDYDRIVERFLDNLAKKSNVDRFKIYEISELSNLILNSNQNLTINDKKLLNSLKNV